ncbi:M43 family zinc metalloprotease [Formosa sp. S-31]|uniref:M43 family zinc metalloprotease n=1 Tax=Formosa sp. S-31 TaxID=2790949 RepID=UPI003EBB71CE
MGYAQDNTLTPAEGEQCGFINAEIRLQSKHPSRLDDTQFESWLSPKITKLKAERSLGRTDNSIIQIPVVVHVIHDGDSYGKMENITDSQIESQITVLNQDFRKMMDTPGYNDNPVGADIGIEFVLAKQTPDRCPTNGIDRVNMQRATWSEEDIDDILKPATIWDPEHYLNMWSVVLTRTDLLGYAQFPSASGLDGMPVNGGAANSDGVVCRYNSFGSIAFDDGTFNLSAPYNLGRTMTHEVGHFLGLRHIWGDGGCSLDDYVADTPLSSQSNTGCPAIDTCNEEGETEPVYDMVENYMDYTNDACMNIFTQGQKERILAVLANSPRRVSLVTSNKDEAPDPVENDPSIELAEISIPECGTQVIATVKVTNYGTLPLTELTITSGIENTNSSDYKWTGSIDSGKSELINLPGINTVSGTFNFVVSTSNPNGKTDDRTCNNEASKEFKMTSTYTSTSVINMKLKTDKNGKETTWKFLDSDGNIIDQGGGNYWGNFKVNKSFQVNQNECYTFVINDSGADGMCCTNGEGYFTLTAEDGTVIYSGGEFESEERINITTQTLSTDDKTFKNGISLYPNPAKNNLNLKVSNLSELPTQYFIYNILGQLIIQKQINTTADLSINTSEFRNGMYFIKVIKEQQSLTLPFVKD